MILRNQWRLLMSRNAISANPEHYIFKIRPKTIFSHCRMGQKFFSGTTTPPSEQKILDSTVYTGRFSRVLPVSNS